jgi:hypothetical protein
VAGALVAVAALANLLGDQRSTLERSAERRCSPTRSKGQVMSRGHVVCHPPATRDEPGSAMEEPGKELPMVGPTRAEVALGVPKLPWGRTSGTPGRWSTECSTAEVAATPPLPR